MMNSLFNWASFSAKEIFASTNYPWQALDEIEDYIVDQSANLGLKKFSKNVFVGEGVKIDQSAKISGPAIIGANTTIGEDTLLRGGLIIGEDCKIGHGSEVKHSIIGNNTNVAHLNYVGDSIIGSNVNLAAGVIVANYKNGAKNPEVGVVWEGKKIATGLKKFGGLIGDGVKIGSNCVINPGTIIGKNTLIYPLVSLRGNIEANKIVKYKQKLEIANRE